MSTHKLKKDSAELVVDDQGAWITNLSDSSGDILFARQEFKTSTGETKLRGGCHVCLPNFGQDASQKLSQHGFCRNSRWNSQLQTDETLVLNLSPDHADYQDLQVVFSIKLSANKLWLELTLHNDTPRPMRIAPAFHPYFAIGSAVTIGVNDQTLRVDECAGTKFIQADAVDLEVGGRRLKLTSSNLHTWALWSDNLGEYFCVEPTLGGNRFLNTKPLDDEILAPNKHASYDFQIEW